MDKAVSTSDAKLVGRTSGLRALAVAGAAGLSLAVVVRYGISRDAVVPLMAVNVLTVIAVCDFETRRIPNRIVLPAWIIALAANIVLHPSRSGEWILSGVVTAVVFLALARLSRGGLGMGDVKLAGFLGAVLGRDVVLALLLGTGASGLFAAALLLSRGAAARKETYALGPFLAAGAIAALFS